MEAQESIFTERYGRTLTEQTKHLKAMFNKHSIDNLVKRKDRITSKLADADGELSTNLMIKISSIEEVITEKQKALTT